MARLDEAAFQILERTKLPIDKNNYVGVELECFTDKALTLTTVLEKELIKRDLHYACSVDDDGSINPKLPHASTCYAGDCTCSSGDFDNTAELKVLGSEKTIFSTIDQVCAMLQDLSCRVNDTCGLHVHLDVRNRDPQKVAALLIKNQAKLWKCVAPARKLSRYCKPVKSVDDRSHHYCFDFTQIARKNTIEVRLHHGTIDAEEIKAFIKMLLEIVNEVPETVATKEYRLKQAKRFGYLVNTKLRTVAKKKVTRKKSWVRMVGGR